jgi:hypothetical protein
MVFYFYEVKSNRDDLLHSPEAAVFSEPACQRNPPAFDISSMEAG